MFRQLRSSAHCHSGFTAASVFPCSSLLLLLGQKCGKAQSINIYKDEVFAKLNIQGENKPQPVPDHSGFSYLALPRTATRAERMEQHTTLRAASQELRSKPRRWSCELVFKTEVYTQLNVPAGELDDVSENPGYSFLTTDASSRNDREFHKKREDAAAKLKMPPIRTTARSFAYRNEVYAKLGLSIDLLEPAASHPGYSFGTERAYKSTFPDHKEFNEARIAAAKKLKSRPLLLVRPRAPPLDKAIYRDEVFAEIGFMAKDLDPAPDHPGYSRLRLEIYVKQSKPALSKDLTAAALKLNLPPLRVSLPPGKFPPNLDGGGEGILSIPRWSGQIPGRAQFFKDEVYAALNIDPEDLVPIPDHPGYSQLKASKFRKLEDPAQFRKERSSMAQKLRMPPLKQERSKEHVFQQKVYAAVGVLVKDLEPSPSNPGYRRLTDSAYRQIPSWSDFKKELNAAAKKMDLPPLLVDRPSSSGS